jgi:hypothetical protein
MTFDRYFDPVFLRQRRDTSFIAREKNARDAVAQAHKTFDRSHRGVGLELRAAGAVRYDR